MNISGESIALYHHIVPRKKEMELDGVIDVQGRANLGCKVAKIPFLEDCI